jgi:hypothetical protein
MDASVQVTSTRHLGTSMPSRGASTPSLPNVFSHVPSTKVREIATMLKAIHAGEDIVAARQKAVQVIEKLRGLVETAAEDTLPITLFPKSIGVPRSPSRNFPADAATRS